MSIFDNYDALRGRIRQPMRTRIRHLSTPDPNGCRWCGGLERGHGFYWVPSAGYHAYAEPTNNQRKARMVAHSEERAQVEIEP